MKIAEFLKEQCQARLNIREMFSYLLKYEVYSGKISEIY